MDKLKTRRGSYYWVYMQYNIENYVTEKLNTIYTNDLF